jgi:thymidylate synthase
VYSNQEEAVKNYLQLPIFNLPKYEYNKKVLTISDYEHGPVLRATVAV